MFNCFQHSLAIGQYWAEAARYVADSLILPLSTRSYASKLYQLVRELEEGYGTLMKSQGITLCMIFIVCFSASIKIYIS